jgi:hypothetical protein
MVDAIQALYFFGAFALGITLIAKGIEGVL